MSTTSASPAPLLPQLSMHFTAFEKLPESCAVPAGYELRPMTLNDQPGYVEIMNANAQLGGWTPERVRELFTGSENKMVLEGSYIITHAQSGRAAAVTSTMAPTKKESRYSVGWVAVSPEHQGKNLSYQVCLAVLLYMKRTNISETCLLTDDFRLPAIKIYIKLGFVPEHAHESHPERWKTVYAKFGLPLPL
jgi:mycothiol synthase